MTLALPHDDKGACNACALIIKGGQGPLSLGLYLYTLFNGYGLYGDFRLAVGRQRKVYWDQRSGVLRSGDASKRKLKGSSRATRTLREACWAGRAHGRECGAGSAACAAHVRGMFTDLERPQAAFEAVGLSSGKSYRVYGLIREHSR